MKNILSVTLFGILVCVLTTGFILPEPLTNYGSNLAYAKPRGPVRPDDPPDLPLGLPRTDLVSLYPSPNLLH